MTACACTSRQPEHRGLRTTSLRDLFDELINREKRSIMDKLTEPRNLDENDPVGGGGRTRIGSGHGDHGPGASAPGNQRGAESRAQPLSRRERSAQKRSGRAGTPASPASRWCQRLFLVRESTDYDYLAFEQMAAQTLVRHAASDPNVAKVMAFGSLPMQRTPEAAELRESLKAMEVPKVGWWWRSGDDIYFYALASAANLEDGSNPFTDALCELIRNLRPAALYAGPFSRVVRDKHIAGQLAIVLRKAKTTVHVDEQPEGIDLNGIGAVIWDTLALAVDFDRTQTVTRNLIGTLLTLESNSWPRNAVNLPLGYRLADDDSGAVIADEDPKVRAQTSRLITLAADATKSLDDIADELSELGVRTRDGKADRRCLLNQAADKRSAVRSMLAHLPTYTDGSYSFFHKNPLEGIDSIAGFRVKRDHPDSPGYFQVDLAFGQPSQPWCQTDLIFTAIAKRLNGEPSTNEKEDLPVPSATWSDGAHDYWLQPRHDRYTLRRRPHSTKKFGRNDGACITSIEPSDMHRAMAGAIAAALEDGIPSDLGGATAAELQTALEKAEIGRSDAEALGDSYAEAGARSATDLEQQRYQELASKQWARAGELRVDTARLQAELNLVSTDGLAARFSGLAAALEAATREDRPPAPITATLRSWIDSVTVCCQPGAPSAEVSLSLRVPTALRSVIIGPITFEVATTGTGSVDPAHGSTARVSHDLAQIISGSSVDQVAAGRGITKRLAQRLERILKEQGATPLEAHAILTHPMPAVRRALADMLPGAPSDTSADGIPFDKRWCQHLRAVYRQQGAVGARRGPLEALHPKAQILLDHVRLDPGVTVEDLSEAMRRSGGWRDIYSAAKRGWVNIEGGRVTPIGDFDLVCTLPEATGSLVNSQTLATLGGATLPPSYGPLLDAARQQIGVP